MHDTHGEIMHNFLYFRVNGITGALPFQKAVCMIRMVAMIPPDDGSRPFWTINFHGTPIPVYPLGSILGGIWQAPRPDDNLIIARSERGDIALWVDDISLFPPEPDPDDQPAQAPLTPPGMIISDDGFLIIEDLERLLASQDLSAGGIVQPEEVLAHPAASDPVASQLINRAEDLSILADAHEEPARIPVLRFSLQYQKYAIEMRFIREVILTREITPVPGTPDFIAGICPVRGEIISLVDLRELLQLSGTGLTDFNQVIVISNNTVTFGILADQISEVWQISPDQIGSPGDIHGGSRFLLPVTDESFQLINAEILLSDPGMIIQDTEESMGQDFTVSDIL